MKTVYYIFAYYLSLVLFGIGGLLLNFACLLCGWLPRNGVNERRFQRLIHHHFAFFLGWMRLMRLGRVEYRGEPPPADGRGRVLVANHPGLMDITYLLARLPEAFCIFKPAIRRNPLLGAAARRAGYLSSNGGVDLLREAAEKVRAGQRLVVFPEGTRTPHRGPLLPFKSGFALIARRAGVPIQCVRIACDSNALTRGRPWWSVPELPIRACVEFGPVMEVDPAATSRDLAATVTAWYTDRTFTRPRPPGERAVRPDVRAVSL